MNTMGEHKTPIKCNAIQCNSLATDTVKVKQRTNMLNLSHNVSQ